MIHVLRRGTRLQQRDRLEHVNSASEIELTCGRVM